MRSSGGALGDNSLSLLSLFPPSSLNLADCRQSGGGPNGRRWASEMRQGARQAGAVPGHRGPARVVWSWAAPSRRLLRVAGCSESPAAPSRSASEARTASQDPEGCARTRNARDAPRRRRHIAGKPEPSAGRRRPAPASAGEGGRSVAGYGEQRARRRAGAPARVPVRARARDSGPSDVPVQEPRGRAPWGRGVARVSDVGQALLHAMRPRMLTRNC